MGDKELGDNREEDPPPPPPPSVSLVNRDGDLTFDSSLHCLSITTRTGIFGRPGEDEREREK